MSKINELAKFLDIDVEDLEESSYSDNVFVVCSRMVKNGHSPEHYEAIIGKFKALLTPLKIQQITDYITGNFWSKESRDKLYYPISRYLKRHKQSKPEYMEIKKDCLYVENVLYHLLSNEDKDYITMYKNAFLDKTLTDNRRLVERNDGEYMVLTDEEADERAKDYIEETVWAFNADFICRVCGLPYEAEEMIRSFQRESCEGANDTILALIENADGLDFFVEEAISADGRGHFLSHYDGEENEVSFMREDDNGIDLHEVTYYVYRTN